MKRLIVSALFCSLFFISLPGYAETLDRIVAIVEDDVILDRELNQEVAAVAQRMQASNAQLPPSYILRKQVLERMIVDKLQRQMAEKAGISVTEEMLNSSVNVSPHGTI